MPETAIADVRDVEERVLAVVRALAQETGGQRAAGLVGLDASLERELGLGSLERVELLSRLEAAFTKRLDERFLRLDTPRQVARALAEWQGTAPDRAADAAAAAAPSAAAPLRAGAATVHEVLWRRAEREPDRPHVYMREDDGREHTITYGKLLEDARALAFGLRERGVSRGAAVALMLPTGEDFLRAFQGILMAGAVPVPIYPPVRLDRLDEYASRQSAILQDAGVMLLVTIPRAAPIASLLEDRVSTLRDVVSAEELIDTGGRWPSPQGASDDPAFIQYTSGSTGQPKGVLLTHENLLANIRAISQGLGARPTDVGVSWLPLYHDMGLIGSWLFCMHDGLPIDVQSPLSFLSRPERWLWAIHKRRGTLSAAPNFAYELCVRRVADAALAGLDLSSWRCAINGAEPVNPDTLERFARRFERYGFRREALLPVYGLAENSVALCFPPVDRGPQIDRVERGPFESEGRARPAAAGDATALRFVSVGRALAEHEVRIVDSGGAPVGERNVGRLVFRGPSMTSGYYRKPETSAAIRLEGGFLDSGDLAYQADGEFYITGRVKDLIIKAGRNLVPQEIEEAAASVEGIRKGCVVAIGVMDESDGTERLVVVAETRVEDAGERERLAAAVTDRVSAAVGLPPDRVELVPPGVVPKTSSGKLRRSETAKLLRRGGLGRGPRTSRARQARLLAAAAVAELRPRLSAVRRALFGAYLAVALVPPLLLAWLLVELLPGRKPALALERAFFRLMFFIAGFRLRVHGLEHLRGPGPRILACNHASYADIPVLLALVPRDFLFVAKKEIASWPLVGAFVRRAGHLTVDRWDAPQSINDAASLARAIEDGWSVLVFPEGTFTAAAGLRPFRLGAFAAAVQTGAPVVPLALSGTRRVLRDGDWLPRPGPIELWAGLPMSPAGEGFRAVLELRDRVADAIAARCQEPRLDLVAGGPERA
jgi:1-acyl-sn-glycerol-3-phosphate acyltransferase